MVIKRPFRPPALGRKTKVVLAFALAVAVIFALFDWNWFRHPLERYLTETSGREVRAGDMHVALGFTLEPTVRFRGVYIENAPWAAAKRPYATIGELSITFSLASVWRDRPVISRLVLVDADVDMERQADGLRNWRLRHPNDRGPGRVKVLALEAHRTQLHFVNHAIGLDFVAVASPSQSPDPGHEGAPATPHRTPAPGGDRRIVEPGDDRLTARISFEGSYRGQDFKGEALNAGVLSFRESGIRFPLRGHIVSRNTRLDFDGFFTDLFDIGPMDAKVRLAGPTLSQLHPFVRIQPPASRPYAFEAQLTQTNSVFSFARLQGKIGGTALTGDVTYDRRAARPLLQATLHSDAADLNDIGPLAGMRTANPGKPFRVESLRSFDARVRMSATRFSAPAVPMLESLRIDAVLNDGWLELKPIALGVAGGRAVGSIVFDGRRAPPSVVATMEVREVRLERLLSALSAKARIAGVIRGQVNISGHGDSVAAMFGSATGSFDATIDGGRISNLADAKLGLDFGKVISAFIRGERDIAIHCAAVAFDFRDGVGNSRMIVLDTEQTHVEGKGTINLRNAQVDLLLTPEAKKPGLFTRRASIGVRGPFSAPVVSIQALVKQERALPAGCRSS